MEEQINNMLGILAEAPDSQIDKFMTDHLKKLIGKPLPEIKRGVMYAIDMCVHGGLSSGFALEALNVMHKVFLEGSDEDFTAENCPWRENSSYKFE